MGSPLTVQEEAGDAHNDVVELSHGTQMVGKLERLAAVHQVG